jgi:NAD(P)-dependent dehydrogenase (short-subunit alcohol dehydrogenase family)
VREAAGSNDSGGVAAASGKRSDFNAVNQVQVIPEGAPFLRQPLVRARPMLPGDWIEKAGLPGAAFDAKAFDEFERFELARLTLGGMCKRDFGRLDFTSSTAGEKAEPRGSACTASKHGVIGLARGRPGPRAVRSHL